VWTSRDFQTVGAATQNALDANAMVAGGCCNSRADVERIKFYTVGNPGYHNVGIPGFQTWQRWETGRVGANWTYWRQTGSWSSKSDVSALAAQLNNTGAKPLELMLWRIEVRRKLWLPSIGQSSGVTRWMNEWMNEWQCWSLPGCN